MGDAVLHDPKMLIVLNRFEIKLGFGDKTIEQICNEHNINVDFFLEISNAFHDSSYFTENKLKQFSLELIVSFLSNSHNIYINKKIYINIIFYAYLLNSFIAKTEFYIETT